MSPTYALFEVAADSLEVVAAQASQERALLTAHAEAMDSKAGLLVGFAATVTAFSVAHHDWLVRVALFASLLAGMTGLWGIVVRRSRVFLTIDLDGVFGSVEQPAPATTAQLLDAQRQIVRRLERTVGLKAVLLQLSAGFLVVALLLLLVANLVS